MNLFSKAGVGLLVVSFLAGLGVSSLVGESSSLPSSLSAGLSSIQTAFCPSPECTTLPISAIDSAKERVWVAMYSFTNEDFANALVRAHERGVVVRVLVERQQAGSQYSQHGKLAAAGMVVRIDSNPNYMHDKFAVLDADTLINGSMNWTGNGVRENNENVMIVVSRELNEQFANEFQKIWDESDAYSIN